MLVKIVLPRYLSKLLKALPLRLYALPILKARVTLFLPFSSDKPIQSRPGEVFYMDVCGPISIPAKGGYHYFVTFTEKAASVTRVLLLKERTREVYNFI